MMDQLRNGEKMRRTEKVRPAPETTESVPVRDPEEEGSAARPRQTPAPEDNDPEEEGSAARPNR